MPRTKCPFPEITQHDSSDSDPSTDCESESAEAATKEELEKYAKNYREGAFLLWISEYDPSYTKGRDTPEFTRRRSEALEELEKTALFKCCAEPAHVRKVINSFDTEPFSDGYISTSKPVSTTFMITNNENSLSRRDQKLGLAASR